jgi:hypothetical protein
MQDGGNPSPSTLSTTDIALAAYYMVNGLELVDVRPIRGASGSLDCEFKIRDERGVAPSLRIKFTSSPEFRFDSQTRSLRKLIAEARQRKRR